MVSDKMDLSQEDVVPPKDIETRFLEYLHQHKIPISIYLKSGIRLKGVIELFDDNALYLVGVINQLVCKQSICTILPDKMPDEMSF